MSDSSNSFLVQLDYINTSHPSFIGGSKAVEAALQQHRSAKVSFSTTKFKVCYDQVQFQN
jgi:hypothetical protein